MHLRIDKTTILKHDVAGPRYTSYPAAPAWNEDVTSEVYQERLKKFGESEKTLSLYFHLPFCRSLCTFCACNVIIRQPDEKYGNEYNAYLLKEMAMVSQAIGKKMTVKQLHWGGGTPTFLTELQMEKLFLRTEKHFNIDKEGEIAIEIDPRTISFDKLKCLRQLGFNRISLGVQDFNAKVQQSVNRIQPFEVVERCTTWVRQLGFKSINFDLIYGLPHQTTESFRKTVDLVMTLKPNRIALYSFAYLPWLKKHQRKMDLSSLPTRETKLDIFLLARDVFVNNGYQSIAMDHFALADDELAQAFNAGKLYRNFMGYTVKPADEYIGLGVSSIGFFEDAFIQNHKILRDYYETLDKGQLPVERGKILSQDDRIRQWVIHSFMCHFEINKREFKDKFFVDFDEYFSSERAHLNRCLEDGLICMKPDQITASGLGKIFIRNVCMGFDAYLPQMQKTTRFSQTV
ncbi:MAG: oxygen-independent coproporphyrinogen III oxidase [Candidatus Omnitrophota bacterium]|nr:oxygen-independent coproporphyrinogen III oxidase [Candidatus Omnitrophota bacterium]